MPTITEKFWNRTLGTPIPPPNDIEGIATLVLFDEDENQLEVVGCIVRNNEKLKQIISPKHSPMHLHVQKFKKTQYYAYFQNVQARSLDYRRAVITVEDSTLSPNERIIMTCKVDNLVTEEKIAKEGGHAFVPCESTVFDKSYFLRYYSKSVINMSQSLTFEEDQKLYGLAGKGKEERFDLICLELTRDRKFNNRFVVNDEVYDKLVDGPLFLDDKITLLGCCTKDEKNRKITIHTFGKKEPIDVWIASCVSKSNQETVTDPSTSSFNALTPVNNEQTNNSSSIISSVADNDYGNGAENGVVASHGNGSDGSHGNGSDGSHGNVSGDDHGNVSGDDHGNVSGDDHGNVSGDVHGNVSGDDHGNVSGDDHGNVSGDDNGNDEYVASCGRNLPVEWSLSVDPPMASLSIQNVPDQLSSEEEGSSGSGPIPHSLLQVKLSELCQKDYSMVQDLGLHLDKKTSNVNSDILSLADKVNAHHVIKSKCRTNYNHSPASELFELYEVGIHSVQSLIYALRDIQRQALADLIETHPGIDIQKPVHEVLLASNHELLEKLTSQLDESGQFNWHRLGMELGIKRDVLDKIESPTNPAQNFLIDYAYSALPSQQLRVSRLYEHMKTLDREEEVKTLFHKYHISEVDGRSMKDVFRPYSNEMDELCQLLNKNHCSKGWLHLAQLWVLKSEKYLYFIPDTTASPTRILLEWLMMANPGFTVSRLYNILIELDRIQAGELLVKKLKDAYAVSRRE